MFPFVLLAFLNALLALYLSVTTDGYEFAVNDFLEGRAVPLWTALVIRYGWWPWVGVAVCVVGAMLSLWRKPKDNMLWHLLTVILIAEFAVMLISVMAFRLPWARLGTF